MGGGILARGPIVIPEPVLAILRRLEAAGYETWCVGGAIRDALAGNPHQDLDLATAAKPEVVRTLFPRTVAVGMEHGTVGVLDDDGVLHEVTTFRRDVTTDGRHAVVEFGVSLDEDLARRDFTINAIAYHPIRQEWRDPFHGYDDFCRWRGSRGRRSRATISGGPAAHPARAAVCCTIRLHDRASDLVRRAGTGRRHRPSLGRART